MPNWRSDKFRKHGNDHAKATKDWNRAMDERRDVGRKYGTSSAQYKAADRKVKDTGSKAESLLRKLT
jgi:hypothetical protein